MHGLDLNFSRLTVMRLDADQCLDQRLAQSIQADMRFVKTSKYDIDHHAKVVKAFGPIQIGEAFGWEPPFQVTLDGPHALRKFAIADRIDQLKAIGPLEYHRAFKDVMEAAQYSGDSLIRLIGAGR